MGNKISDEDLFKGHQSLFYLDPENKVPRSIELNIKGNDNQTINILENGLVILNRIKNDSICFVGLNPSIPKDKNPNELYDKNSEFKDNKVHFNSLNENDEGNKSNDLRYFKRLKNVAENIGCEWSALDIFSIRSTNMSAIKDALDKDANKETQLGKLCKGQFELFKEQIQNLKNPKAIIVCNAYASKWFFGEELKLKQKSDEEKREWKKENKISGDIFNDSAFKMKFEDSYGTYVIVDDPFLKLNGTPVFFSGMLSGTRPLDLGSLQRLIYNVKWVINQRSTK
jgi:hypothetical protein